MHCTYAVIHRRWCHSSPDGCLSGKAPEGCVRLCCISTIFFRGWKAAVMLVVTTRAKLGSASVARRMLLARIGVLAGLLNCVDPFAAEALYVAYLGDVRWLSKASVLSVAQKQVAVLT
jgi:hypothetical protein